LSVEFSYTFSGQRTNGTIMVAEQNMAAARSDSASSDQARCQSKISIVSETAGFLSQDKRLEQIYRKNSRILLPVYVLVRACFPPEDI
jgi:hypothetical protein